MKILEFKRKIKQINAQLLTGSDYKTTKSNVGDP